jgi:CRISPR-associated protein Cas1
MQQLRGREGARVRKVYRAQSDTTGVKWRSRKYDPNDFDASDKVNKALSAANTALYGAVHCVVVALGCAPGLGFVHTGHDRSFVYDMADLYKADIAIPTAFQAAADEVEDIGAHTRRKMRDAIHATRLMERSVRDVRRLLLPDEAAESPDLDIVGLWDGASGAVSAGQNHSDFDPSELDW